MQTRLIGLITVAVLLAGCKSSPETSGAMNQTATGSGIQVGPTMPGTEADLVQNVGDRVFFDYDKSDLSP